MRRRKQQVEWQPPVDLRIHVMGPTRWSTLATYNTERARGLVHTPEWDELMVEEQRKFNEEQGR